MATQKNQLNKLYIDKANNDRSLEQLRLLLISAMYKSLCDKESYIKRAERLAHIYLNNKEQPIIRDSISIYNKISKRKEAYVPGFGKVLLGSILFAYLIDHLNVNEALKVKSNKYESKKLGEQKEAIIMSDIQKNRIEKKYFYLCSKHGDSAKDHEPYQGKLYIDSNCDDSKSLALAKQYNMKEYQWVIGAPVYMVTRPNCRHYFRALTYNEVKGKSYNDLVNEYDMYKSIGPRGSDKIQTLSSKGKEITFVIKSYQERLKMHEMMYKTRPNEFLKRCIEKDNLLIKKWKNSLFKNKNQ